MELDATMLSLFFLVRWTPWGGRSSIALGFLGETAFLGLNIVMTYSDFLSCARSPIGPILVIIGGFLGLHEPHGIFRGVNDHCVTMSELVVNQL